MEKLVRFLFRNTPLSAQDLAVFLIVQVYHKPMHPSILIRIPDFPINYLPTLENPHIICPIRILLLMPQSTRYMQIDSNPLVPLRRAFGCRFSYIISRDVIPEHHSERSSSTSLVAVRLDGDTIKVWTSEEQSFDFCGIAMVNRSPWGNRA